MNKPTTLAVFLSGLALAAAGCSGFGENCSSDAQCPAGAACDPTLKVCFQRPTVTSIVPADGTSGVAPAGATVQATFSVPINDAGVTNETFTVDGQGFTTPGNYLASASSTSVTFEPFAGMLALGTQYQVNLTDGIHDLGGGPLVPFTSTFSTQDGAWLADVPYPSPTGTSTGDFSVGVNFYGEVVAGFDNRLGPVTSSDFELLAGVAPSGALPQIDKTVYSVTGDEVFGPSLSISNSGRAFAAFSVANTGFTEITAKGSSFDPATRTWSTPVPLTPSTNTSGAQVIAQQGGTALAVWSEQGSTGSYQLFARSYSAGWAVQPETIQDDETVDSLSTRLGVDLDGDVLAVWVEQGASLPTSQVFAAKRPASGSFETPGAISNVANNASQPDVAVGYYGFGGAAWEESSGGNQHVFARAFDPSQSPAFGVPKQLDSAVAARFPRAGAAANGDVVVVWAEPGATGGSIGASRYSASTGAWSAPLVLASDPTNPPRFPVVAVDPGGNAIVAWTQTSGTADVAFGRRFTVGGGWVPPLAQPPRRLTTGTDTVFGCQAVVDGTGRGTVFCTRYNGTSSYLDYIGFQ